MQPVANSEIKIKTFDFSDNWVSVLKEEEKWQDWPVVYFLHDDKEWYVWETASAIIRMKEHLKTDKKRLKKAEIIFDETFNKSAILDLEQRLIQFYSVDWKFKLLNWNWWQSTAHNYYQREWYVSKIDKIWMELSKLHLTDKTIKDIRNSDLFKFSPYTSLTEEQNNVSRAIINDMMEKLEKWQDWTAIIKWWAWTWKTIVIINMIYKLINAWKVNFDKAIDEDSDLSEYVQFVHDLQAFVERYKWKGWVLKIAYVSPMTSLRKTLKVVFKNTKNWLKWNLVMWPTDLVHNVYKSKAKYDIVFVDEAHRLAQRKNIWWMEAFDKCAKESWLDKMNCNSLDFIVKNSKYRVLVYDENQTVKWADITKEQFKNSLKDSKVSEFELSTQMRCKWWQPYLQYIADILDWKQDLSKKEISNYEFKLFLDVDDMIKQIRELERTEWLCRNMCSESWPWISKWLKYPDIIKQEKQDIRIGKYKYPWNTRVEWWIISDTAINEIGCIHTVQWYDLNYAWLIFWREIDYDENTNQIVIYKDNFFSDNIKKWADDKKLKEYILNAYKVMMTRGIKWTFVYAYHEWLRKYLWKFIDVIE